MPRASVGITPDVVVSIQPEDRIEIMVGEVRDTMTIVGDQVEAQVLAVNRQGGMVTGHTMGHLAHKDQINIVTLTKGFTMRCLLSIHHQS